MAIPPDDPKKKLSELAAAIAALVKLERKLSTKQLFPPTVPFDLADWFVGAVDSFLSNEGSDFAKALGLKRGPGRPTPPPSGKNYERAKKIFWMRGLGKRPSASWLKIAEEFPEADVRDLQRELTRYTTDIIADISGELAGLLDRREAKARLNRVRNARAKRSLG